MMRNIFSKTGSFFTGFLLSDPESDPGFNLMFTSLANIPAVSPDTADAIVKMVAGLSLTLIYRIIENFATSIKEKKDAKRKLDQARQEIELEKERLKAQQELDELKIKFNKRVHENTDNQAT